MKKTLLAAASLLLSSSVVFSADLTQKDNQWYKDAQAALKERLAVQINTKQAKNVILLIADGNGVGTNYATRIYQGQTMGKLGEEHNLAQDMLPHVGLVKTYNTNAQTPDSAGTGTAMHSGVKTKAGVIGVDESLNRGDCSQVEAAKVANAAEIFSAMGKEIGVVSTARLTHATPASAYAHSADRNFEDNSKMPEGCAVPDIASQLLGAMKSGMVDIALGGGRRHFIPKDHKGEEGKGGKRTDGKNLIEDFKAAGIQYVWNDETFKAADLSKPVIGLFESSHMKYEHDRTGEPSLAEMTEAAIKKMENSENGYFLTVEAGRVDHANHANNGHRVLTDGVAFADAVAKAVELTKEEDTLIIVTADHEHAIAFNGYCGRGNPITGICMGIDGKGTKYADKPVLGKDGKPYTVIGYLNGSSSILDESKGWTGGRPELTMAEAQDPDYVQQSLVPRSSESHSGEDVAVYARGPWAHLFNSTLEQNEVFHVMLHAFTAK